MAQCRNDLNRYFEDVGKCVQHDIIKPSCMYTSTSVYGQMFAGVCVCVHRDWVGLCLHMCLCVCLVVVCVWVWVGRGGTSIWPEMGFMVCVVNARDHTVYTSNVPLAIDVLSPAGRVFGVCQLSQRAVDAARLCQLSHGVVQPIAKHSPKLV
jgi:hypothetical protein